MTRAKYLEPENEERERWSCRRLIVTIPCSLIPSCSARSFIHFRARCFLCSVQRLFWFWLGRLHFAFLNASNWEIWNRLKPYQWQGASSTGYFGARNLQSFPAFGVVGCYLGRCEWHEYLVEWRGKMYIITTERKPEEKQWGPSNVHIVLYVYEFFLRDAGDVKTWAWGVRCEMLCDKMWGANLRLVLKLRCNDFDFDSKMKVRHWSPNIIPRSKRGDSRWMNQSHSSLFFQTCFPKKKPPKKKRTKK